MAWWLMKSEPGSYGWDDLARDGGTESDGVRNPAAAGHLRAMRPGDRVFLYHSGKDKAAVGLMEVTKADPRLSSLAILRQSRLSVAPVGEAEAAAILDLGGESGERA